MGKAEFRVLTKIVDDSDPFWNTNTTVCGSPAQVKAVFDLSAGVPYGWRLLKNKAARRFLKWSLREEMRWQREQQAKENFAGNN